MFHESDALAEPPFKQRRATAQFDIYGETHPGARTAARRTARLRTVATPGKTTRWEVGKSSNRRRHHRALFTDAFTCKQQNEEIEHPLACSSVNLLSAVRLVRCSPTPATPIFSWSVGMMVMRFALPVRSPIPFTVPFAKKTNTRWGVLESIPTEVARHTIGSVTRETRTVENKAAHAKVLCSLPFAKLLSCYLPT